ncbi:hypothetical protein I7I53_03225 [Histoplasma capsulatum var. duboisii H88]|uniref:Uncharacterized protein n=1 Tax=Ajellomyces capsulatus (strain H88) TaxID=544711 RepID=A0A8A1LSG1_AJEC8|nr:hypothetical protein I7I53_03225 [Histoplasma capsulatum var. duboisii H88]
MDNSISALSVIWRVAHVAEFLVTAVLASFLSILSGLNRAVAILSVVERVEWLLRSPIWCRPLARNNFHST